MEKRIPSRVENLVTVVAVAVPAVWLGLIVQAYMHRSAEKQEIAQGISNCRQIILALRLYSADHASSGPDIPDLDEISAGPKTSNEGFRILFKEKILEKEHIFGCPHSPYVPDGMIGAGPNFEDALKKGENHWMLTTGLSDSASGNIPLVYENASVAKWDPKWNADVKRKPVPGRTWTKGIIIGMNDSSVALQKLASATGSEVPLKSVSAAGKNLFTQQNLEGETEAFKVLDVER